MIKIKNMSKSFYHGKVPVPVFEDLNFHLGKTEFVTIIGRSGSGKSTLLDLIMGLIQPTSGEIVREKEKLSIGYVFQKPALLPWRTVFDNVGLPLVIAGIPKFDREQMIMNALEKVGLAYAFHCYPYQLSGGMAQRAAIARALVQDPDLLLMDEPFSSLDPLLRDNLNVNLIKLWERTKKTILFVTHSINEAVILSNRILILEEGRFTKEFEIDLPRPRDFHTFHNAEYLRITKEIREHLPVQPNLPRVIH